MNIKNLLFQPLALHLATDGRGLHLSARECREILSEHISEEIRLAARRGLVSLIEKAAHPVDDVTGEKPESSEGSPTSVQPEHKKGNRR